MSRGDCSLTIGSGVALAGICIGIGIGIFGMAGCEARGKEAFRKSEIRNNEINAESRWRAALLKAKREGVDIETFVKELPEKT